VRENPDVPGIAIVRNGKVTGRTRRRLEREIASLQQEIERFGKIAEKQERKEQPPVPAESVVLPAAEMEKGEMVDEPVVAVLKNGKLTRRSRKELRKQVNAIQKDIDRLDKAVRKESYRRARPTPTTDDVRETVETSGQEAGKRLGGIGAAATGAFAPLIERAQGLKVQKNISQFASSAQKSARQLADTTRGQTSELSDRVRSDLLPQLAVQASKVQEQVPQLAERVRNEVLPQVVERAQQLRNEVTPQITEAATKASTQASALAATGVALGRDKAKGLASTDLAADLTERAKQQTYKGRKAAAKGLHALAAQIEPPKPRRNLTGLWIFALLGAIGGALYYFVYLNEERRKKVIETTQSIVEQGREIIRDFQGYDEEF
jgi:hypothetical protein